MDSYQPIYDAVRSRIIGGNISDAVKDAIRNCGLDHAATMASRTIQEVAWQYERPSVLFRPSIFIDGNKWCALYGDNLQDGIAGFGDSLAEAMIAFDQEFQKKINVEN